MPVTHVVAQGECLSVIARRYGFVDYRLIYDHPSNAAFKRRRPNPHVIRAGDRVVIPEKTLKEVAVATAAVHTFVVAAPKRRLHVVFEDDVGTPFANLAYRLNGVRFDREGTTDADGAIMTEVPMRLNELRVEVGRLVRTLRLGHLDPTWDEGDDAPIISGIQARLANLGYAPGAVDGVLGPRTLRALHAFLRDRQMRPSGPTREAAARLESDHGC